MDRVLKRAAFATGVAALCFLVGGAPSEGRRLESGGTPVYDIAHHEWGYKNSITSRDCTFLSFFIGLLVVSLCLGSVVSRRWAALPEAVVVLAVGVVAGVACKAARGTTSGSTRHHFFTKPLLGFDTSLFFLGLLPPIIFRSGYELRTEWLVSLWGPILSLAVGGTLVSAIVVAVVVLLWSAAGGGPGHRVSPGEALAFGALVSATDPVSVLAVFAERRVDPKLFYLVFGESVLNDAVGIVLFKTFSKTIGADAMGVAGFLVHLVDFFVIFCGSMALGMVLAAGCALLLRALRVPQGHGRD